jgi:MFS family permease
MQDRWRAVQRTYLVLLLLHTLAASLIWGINTLFLLDAGLTNTQAFAANAFFTLGFVLFEIPTGVVADVRGRRLSYLLGTLTLTIATLLYLLLWRIHAPFWAWAIVSGFLGLGFTFFSGAVQAWLVDALRANGYRGGLEAVFARGEIVEGIAMLSGSVAGGLLAQFTNIGVPYVLRAAMLALSFVLAFRLMRDEGFTAQRSSSLTVVRKSVRYGLGEPAVRWVMLANFFTDGVSIYAFYAMQPFLLALHGNPHAYWIAGLAAAVVGGAQIVGGLLAPRVAGLARKRTTILLLSVMISSAVLLLIGLFPSFWTALVLLVMWGLVFAMVAPVRQAYVNDLIPSEQRATVLSFDSLVGSTGGAAVQPLLGRAADAWGYPASYACSAAVQACAIPLLWIAHHFAPHRDDAA